MVASRSLGGARFWALRACERRERRLLAQPHPHEAGSVSAPRDPSPMGPPVRLQELLGVSLQMIALTLSAELATIESSSRVGRAQQLSVYVVRAAYI